MNRKNLKKLADYLADLPEGGPKFNMGMFYTKGGGSDGCFYRDLGPCDVVEHTCGFAACAVGHATHVKGLEAYEDEDSWDEYIDRVFGSERLTYAWCFDDSWEEVDNTPEGASKRINYMLKHGTPDGFDDWRHISEEMVALYQ